MLHNFTSASCKTLLFQSISCCKTHLHLASLKQYLWANSPEYNERSANFQHCQQQCYSFPGIPSIFIVGRFYGNEWKIILSWTWIIASFLNKKSLWSTFFIWSWILVKKRTLRVFCSVHMASIDHKGITRIKIIIGIFLMTFKWSLFCPDYAIYFFLLGWHIWKALAIPSSHILPKWTSESGIGLETNFLDY